MNAFIRSCASRSDLVKYAPPVKDADDEDKRCALLHASVDELLNLKRGTLRDRQRLEMNQQLSAFVAGKVITIVPAPVPPKEIRRANCDVRGLSGYRDIIWEMRFRFPTHYRLLGVVPQKDYFVGLVLAERKGINWKFECGETLRLYDQIRGSGQCGAISATNATNAFSKWRIPS